MKNIGANFVTELGAAGLLGLPFSWGSDGSITFGEGMTQEQISSVEAVYAAHIPEDALVKAKKAQIVKINAACQAQLDAITTPYPLNEIHTWDQQLAEANAYTTDSATPTPLLSAIVEASGSTMAALVDEVITASNRFKVTSGAAIGKRHNLKDQINAATTVEAVLSIVW